MTSMLPQPEDIRDFVRDELLDIMPDDETRDAFMEDHGTDMINSFNDAINGTAGDYILQEYTNLFREIYEGVRGD